MTATNHRTKESAENVYFVTGATGNVGRHVVSELLATGAGVRVLTRNPEAAGPPPEVDVVRGDLNAPLGLEKCFDAVDTVFLLWRSFTADPARQFLEAASKHARRIVFLSSSAIRDDLKEQDNPIAKVHADIENLIQRSGLEWTFLRPGGLASNALMWWGPQIRAGNIIRWPYGGASFAPIHERDIAAVAVRALTEQGHDRKKYILTGPQALSQIEQVAILADATRRSLLCLMPGLQALGAGAHRIHLPALSTCWKSMNSACPGGLPLVSRVLAPGPAHCATSSIGLSA